MRIVVPMAGHSERFQRAGYTVPKPFLMLGDQPMIHWVCDMFSPEDHFVFLVQQPHADVAEYRQILETAAPRHTIIPVKPNRKGPLYTALAADDVVDDGEPVILTYCDFYQHWNYRQFLWTVDPYHGGIAIFKGFIPASFGTTYYAYLRCNERGEMLELREKQAFTDQRYEERASSGVYYIGSWALFRRYAQRVLREQPPVGSEYYVSLLFNPLIADGYRTITFEVERFICWGTPADVEQYIFWSDYFRNDARRILGKAEGGPP